MGESDLPASVLPTSFSVHLARSAVTPAGSVHKSKGVYVDAVEEMMCAVCVGVTAGDGDSGDECVWRGLCVSMI